MEYKSLWPLLRAGKMEREQGLELCREAYVNDPSALHIMQLGIAYLWLKQYAQAWEHFSTIIKQKAPKGTSNKHECFYGMAGVAKWCLGERREAIAEWVSGLKAHYASAGGVKSPLLLFFASVVTPELYDNDAARKLMLEKAKDVRIKAWPGPILPWLLGQVNGGEFLRLWQCRHEHDLREHFWQAEFYKSVMRFERSKISDFRESMHKLTDIQQPEWQDEDAFLSRIWKEEFFLARYEAHV